MSETNPVAWLLPNGDVLQRNAEDAFFCYTRRTPGGDHVDRFCKVPDDAVPLAVPEFPSVSTPDDLTPELLHLAADVVKLALIRQGVARQEIPRFPLDIESLRTAANHMKAEEARDAQREAAIEELAEYAYEAERAIQGVEDLRPQWCDVTPNNEKHWLVWAEAMLSNLHDLGYRKEAPA